MNKPEQEALPKPYGKWTLIQNTLSRCGTYDPAPLNAGQASDLIEELAEALSSLAKAEERNRELQKSEERLQVQLAGCGVAATGWATEENRAKHGDYGWSPAFEDIMKLREHSWRCFHCGFFTLDEKSAAAHFGDRDDPDEFKPLCKWMDRTPIAEQAFLLQDAIRDLNEERDENMRLIDRAEVAESKLSRLREAMTMALPLLEEELEICERSFLPEPDAFEAEVLTKFTSIIERFKEVLPSPPSTIVREDK